MIFDAHLTILLAGAVLYFMGSEQVKGFALTLMLGLAANLFTAVFVCRLMFDILEAEPLGATIPHGADPQPPALRFRRQAVSGGGRLGDVDRAGLAAAFLRGNGMLDIDFTGGTAAVIHMAKPMPIDAVRRLTDEILPDATVEEVQIRGGRRTRGS